MKEYINYCLKYQISFEQFGLLYMIANDMIDELKEYIEVRGTFNIGLLEELYEKGIIRYQKDGELIMFSTISIMSSKYPFYSLDIDSWITEWFDLFPRGIKSGGYLVRSDIKACKKKMQQFMKDYPEFDKDIIMAATKAYISEMEQKGYSYMKLAPFFIIKDGTSLLNGYCDNVLNGGMSEEVDPFAVKA